MKPYSRQRQRELVTIDRQLAAALTLLLILYMTVTIGTFLKLPLSENNTVFEDATSITTASLEKMVDDDSQQYTGIEKLQHTFPVHVGTDMEDIKHPGIQFARAPPKALHTHIKVPRFWNPDEYGPGGVRAYLGDWGKRLLTPQEASSIGSFHNGLETIYASIASYRDPECQPTLEDIYLRAKHPERLRVAVIDQIAEGDQKCAVPTIPCDQDPEQALCKYRHLIDVYEMDARLSVGPVFARHLAQRMYRGEYFAMQVDAHVRFTEGWDDDMVVQWKSARNEMAILTTYLSDLVDSIDPVTHRSLHEGRPIMCKSDYEGEGVTKHLRHGQQPEGPARIHGEPTLHPFWAAGFSFARGHFVTQVPYDQYLPMVFQGEEISIGLRAFTYGYDFYTQERPVCFHMYANKQNTAKRNAVRKFWENGNEYVGSLEVAMKRLNHVIKMGKKGEEYFNEDEKKYGLGEVRNPEKFFRTFGIHTETQTVEDNLCKFVGKPMMRVFKPHLRKNRMGIDYSEIDFVFVNPDKPKQNKPNQNKAANRRQ